MSDTCAKAKRTLIALALMGSLFPLGGGCNFATNKDFETFYQSIGDAVITGVSDGAFGAFGDDFDAVIRDPATTFVQSMWDNYVAARVPNDVELK
jgi:hypothetical protein